MRTNSFKRFSPICLFILLGSLSFLSSCVETKQIVYFQGDTSHYISLKVPTAVVKTVQPGDILAIIVNSLSDESNIIFNIPNINNLTVSNFSQNNGIGKSQPSGYYVDSLGSVSLPLIGKVNVKNLTVNVAADSIQIRLSRYLKEPSVSVRILNHKFSILGEVNRPGVYNLIDDRVTIPEALGMAGDLTIFGKRNNVLLIREKQSGNRELVRIDLTSMAMLSSPYYYLEQNDVLYIEPLKTRATTTDQNYQLVPIFTGIVSALGILILNLRN